MRLAPVLALLAPVALVAALVSGCGEGPPAAYTDETRSNVLAPCHAETDPAMVGDVCACTYRSIRTGVPFDRFRQIDQQLREDPTAPLPDDLVELLADCVIEVADL